MGHRSHLIFLICFSASVFTVLILRKAHFNDAGNSLIRSSSSFGRYFGEIGTGGRWIHDSVFYVSRNGKDETHTENEEDKEEVFVKEELGDGDNETNGAEDKVVILMWTKYYTVTGDTLMELILSGRKWDPGCCSQENLIVTLDRNLLQIATVIVFYNYFGDLTKKDLPTRYPGQLWVLFGKESPALSLSLGEFPNLFNWTMTYRLDSDIYCPYGYTETLEQPIPPNEPIIMPGDIPLSQWISNKRSTLAGVISHCFTRSKRESLVEALRNASLPVEIFGICGNRTICPRLVETCDHKTFWRNLGEQYFFYFAAENSICVDYITEKFWRTLERGMVPLVYGGGNYLAVAPPKSYIDLTQFKSPEEIAEYVKMLANNSEEYADYFEWRRTHRVQLTDGWGGWCILCRLAKQYKENPEEMDVSPNKVYADLQEWWLMAKEGEESKACRKPPFNLNKF